MITLQLSANGFVRPGDTLRALSVPVSSTVNYQWFVDDELVPAGTDTTFVATSALVDSTVRLEIRYRDEAGVDVVQVSEPVKINAAPVGLPEISGTWEEDQLVSVATTTTITDADGLGELPLAYQWLADGVEIPGAVDPYLGLGQAQVGKKISIRASYTDGDGKFESVTSAQSAAVRNINDPATGSLQWVGQAVEDQTLTAQWLNLFDEDGLPSNFTYIWLADQAVIAGASSSTLKLTQAQVGKNITLKVQFTDLQGHLEEFRSENNGTVVNVNDPTLGVLAIAGAAKQGTLLQAVTKNLSDEDGMGTFTYQWWMNGQAISGATNSTFLLSDQRYVGQKIVLSVVHKDALGTVEPVLEATTDVIENANDAPTGDVTIVGDQIEDSELTAIATLSDADGLPSDLQYQWLSDGEKIKGATSAKWTLQQAQVGHRISVQVSYTDMLGAAEQVTSAAGLAVQNINDPPAGQVLVIGKLFVGETLTVSTANLTDEDNGATSLGPFSYQWRANGQGIAGATSSTFLLTQSQIGQAISVLVSYTDKWGTLEEVTSSETHLVANENHLPTGKVSISGTVQEKNVLQATQNLNDLEGLGDLTWRWWADDQMVAYGTDRLELTQALVGKAISVSASYTDGLGQSESVTSLPTAKVVNVQDACTGAISILGSAFQGETLFADVYLTDEDGIASVTYQWLAGGQPLVGATQATLLLEQAQVGRQIGLKVLATDNFGASTQFQINRTDLVENINDPPVASPRIVSGFTNQKIKGALTAKDIDGDPFSFLLSLPPTHGRVSINEQTGLFEYVPDANFSGTDQFFYQATDGTDVSAQAEVSLTVTELPYRSLIGKVYFWGDSLVGSGRQLLQNAEIKATAGTLAWSSDLTQRAGTFEIPRIEATQAILTASKSTVSDATVKSAIGLNDVLSALKLYLGKTTVDSSGYAKVAADFDANGKIDLSDVLGILKTYLGKASSNTPQWAFVDASANLAGLTAKACAAPTVDLNLVDMTTTVNLIGILRGDVNGSWSQQSGYDLFSG